MDRRSLPDPRTEWDREYSTKGRMWRALPPEDINVREGSRVLELGCGNGKTLAAIRGEDIHIVGVDISRVGMMLSPAMGSVPMVQGDAAMLPFRGGSFDLVVAHHVLGHLLLEERREASSEIQRVLARGGEARVLVHSRNDMRSGGGKEMEPETFLSGSGIITHFFDEGEVRDLFSSMEVVSVGEVVREKTYSGTRVMRATIEAILRNLQ